MRWPFFTPRVALGRSGFVQGRDVSVMVVLFVIAPLWAVAVTASLQSIVGRSGFVLGSAFAFWFLISMSASVRLSWTPEGYVLARQVLGVPWHRSAADRLAWRVHLHHGLEGQTLMLLRGQAPLTLLSPNVDRVTPELLAQVLASTSTPDDQPPQVR